MARRYRMGSRLQAVKATQARIVDAAKTLHAEQGVQATSYEDIARLAGVAQATVYRHFPTLDELIPVCARSIQVLQPLTPDEAASIFAGRQHPDDRLEWVIRGTCECYERDGDWLQAARREGDLVPALSEVIRIEQESLRLLVQLALEGTGASEHDIRVLAALLDYPLWKSFRDMGLSAADATRQVIDLVRDYLAKVNLS